MAPEVKRYIEKSEKSLKVAKELFELGYFEDACSKAYYVMFYAAQALLLKHSIEYLYNTKVNQERFISPATRFLNSC